MPFLSAFFGIVVRIFHKDHNPPHIHVLYAEFEAIVEIDSGKFLEGKLPTRAKKLFEEWRKIHLTELKEAWSAAQAGRMPQKIKPLE